MNTARIWTLGAVVAIVAIVAAGVGLGVQPQLAAASTADASTKQMQAQNGVTEIDLARLSKLAATQSTLEATNSRLGSAITGSLRLSTFSKQLRDLAALDGVSMTSLSPGVGTTYSPTTTAAAPAVSASGTKTATATAAPPGAFGKTNPLVTSDNFTLIPVTLTVSGSEAALIQFASDAQHLRRLFAVDTVDYAAAATAGDVPTATISGNIYALKR